MWRIIVLTSATAGCALLGSRPDVGLHGSAATSYLKQKGLYGSLGEAVEAARYAIRPVANDGGYGEYAAHNPAQRMHATFSPRGVELRGTSPGEGGSWRSAWRLQSVGYGERLVAVGPGRLQASGARIELRRALTMDAEITEWYVNRPAGLEQGFTITHPTGARRPDEKLRLTLELMGDLRARAGRTDEMELVRADGTPALRYGHLVVTDAKGRTLPAEMQVEDSGESLWIDVDDADAVWPVTVDPTFTQQAYLKASNTKNSDQFGSSVAVSGDTVVVGARTEGSSGAAYVFVRSASTWSQQAYLKVSPSGGQDEFGWSVAVSGETAVAGARFEHSNATGVNGNRTGFISGSGAAYVFVRSGSTWSQQAFLKASNTGAQDWFGSSVAVSGDTVVVGAVNESSNATTIDGDQNNNLAGGSGAAYVFVRSASTWSQQAYLKASNTGANDQFGFSVAVSGDTVVVGAPGEDSNATGVNGDQANDLAGASGAAYVFVLPTNIAPTITPSAVTRQEGASGSALIATVNDTENLPGSLVVTVQSANPSNGVTLSGISNNAGDVIADVAAAVGASNASFLLRVTDAGGAFAEGTLNVTVTQPVTISPNISPGANGNGWHNGPVTVSWTVTNATSQSGCDSTVLSAETSVTGTTLTCSAANAGGSVSQSATIRIDLTPPGAGGSRTPEANTNGWNNTDVTANFTCSDALSGVVTAAASAAVSAEGAGQSRSFTCQDLAGNSAAATVSGINIDKTAPTGTASSTPSANANGWNNSDVTAAFTCADPLSGPVTSASLQTIDTEGTGQSRNFLCVDRAGNSLALSVMGVNIDKTSPVVTPDSVVATPNPVTVNTAVSLSASLTDTGSSNLALAEYRIDAEAYVSFGSASGASAAVTGPIGSFAAPAVLNVCVRATDVAGNQSLEECTMVAVYDPNGGFVTGAGSFQSPPGALTGSTATGRAQFAFHSKYAPGAAVPSGRTQFKFKAGSFEFDSTAYEWLVVAGARAQYKGTGVIKNQTGTFDFMLTVIDGAVPGGGGDDKFRIKIQGPGGIVYDNQAAAADSAAPSTVIDSGNIVIHK